MRKTVFHKKFSDLYGVSVLFENLFSKTYTVNYLNALKKFEVQLLRNASYIELSNQYICLANKMIHDNEVLRENAYQKVMDYNNQLYTDPFIQNAFTRYLNSKTLIDKINNKTQNTIPQIVPLMLEIID